MADAVAADCQDVVVIEEDTNAEDTRANGSRPKTASFIPAVLIAVLVGGRRWHLIVNAIMTEAINHDKEK